MNFFDEPNRLVPVTAFDRAFGTGALVLVLLAGCEDNVCGCPPVDPYAHLIVRGVVQNTAGSPVEGAEVSPLGPLRFDCAVDTHALAADPTPAVSDTDGRFRFLLFSGDGPGVHCFDLLVSDPSSGFVDTISAQGSFVRMVDVPDSISIAVTVQDGSSRGGAMTGLSAVGRPTVGELDVERIQAWRLRRPAID